jgi:beta-lactamase class A
VTPTVQEVLNAWVVSHPTKKWGIAVSSLGSDKISAAVNGGLQFNTASVYKLLLTYPLFQKYNLDSLSQSPYKNCLDLMIKISDNSCGEAIGYGLGWTKATQALRQAGLTSTDLYTSRGPVTTAGDVNRFLTKFYTGELMGNPEKQYVMGLMQLQKYRKGIPTGCSSCVVSDKIGDLGYVRHDVGIVEYKSGAFALTILSNGASYSQIAELTAQIYSSIVDH